MQHIKQSFFLKFFSALLIVMMAIPALPVTPAYAAVGVSGQWNGTALINNNAATSPNTAAYVVPAGTNRLVIITVNMEFTNATTAANVSVTYGGTAVHLITQTAGTPQQSSWVGYLNEADLALAANTTISVTHNTARNRAITVHAATYNGVDQANPIVDFNTTVITNAAAMTFGKTISVLADGYIFYVTNDNGGTATPPAGGGYTEHFDQNYTSFYKSTASKVITTTGNEPNRTITFAGGNDRGSLAVVSLRPAASTATLTLQKTVINDNGGTALDSAWTLAFDDGGSNTGSGVDGDASITNAVVAPGDYTLSESGGPGGYNTSGIWSCTGFTTGSQTDDDTLTLAAGDNVTCVITNDDVAPSLTLQKTVINDNGGTALASAWTLTATGTGGSPTNLSGNTPVTSGATFKADTYTLGESGGPSGYSASTYSCSKNGTPAVLGNSITLTLADSAVCTITNNDIAPTLTLQKTVVNDNGGTALDTAWTLNAAGPTPISGVEGNAAVTNAVVTPGTYTLTESGGPSGYTQTGLSCSGAADANPADGLTIALGETVTCTFTNNDVAPTLTLAKTVVNDNGGSAVDTAWTLNANGPTSISGVEGAGAVTNATVNAGSYTLTETGGPSDYSQTGIACTGSDANGADGLTLLPGENVTCTFTNDDIGATLTLQKTVTNNNGGTAADTAWTLNANGPTPISGVEGAGAVTSATVTPGTYTLTESGGPSGYTQTGLSCVGAADANPADGLTLVAGETVTCTFTNDDIAPTLTLAKTVINDSGGSAVDTAWTLNATGPSTISGTEGAGTVTNATVNAGSYTLTETGGPSGYSQTGIACTGSDANGADGLTLLPGENVTCTFTNDDTAASLTLQKTVVNDNGGTVANTAWTLNATGPTNISGVSGNAAVTNAPVNAGTFTLTESGGPSGYTQTGLACTGAADINPADGLTIALGETVTCTFTNDDVAPTLTLAKDVTNDNGGTAVDTDWTLNAVGPSTINGTEGAGAITNATVDAGSYTLTETGGPSGYTQTAITCDGSDSDGSDGLTLNPGENVTCTFANDDASATLTLVKDVTNDNIGTALDTDWTLNANGPTNISGVEGDAAITSAPVSAGNYTLTESGPAGYTNTAITCNGTDTDGSDGLTLALGEDVICAFANDDDVPVLLVPNINSSPNTGDGSVSENEIVPSTLGITQLTVQFNWDVYDDPADLVNFIDDVTNPANYLLVRSSTGTFNTLSCASGLVAPDINTPVTSVNYSNGGGSGPFVATLTLSTPLTVTGYYRLYVCGTTSIVLAADPTIELAGDGINSGTDFARNFQVVTPTTTGGGGGGNAGKASTSSLAVTALPATGFAPNRVTALPEQPEDLAYSSLGDLWIEVPALGIKTSIVGVPQNSEGEWDVTWLANNVGWLNGTAFPTWEGNSVLTAHVTNADGLDGPFVNLKKLSYGDQIIIHLYGEKYVFEVRNSRLSRSFATTFAFADLEDASYLTLITCQGYNPLNDTYYYRRVVRAVLVSIDSE
ncbi:MAG: sortase [Anaerolineales bacterium]|nr:sortase [Anaerolineales bacterium]